MKKLFTFLAACLIIFSTTKGQVADALANLKAQVTQMSSAFMEADYAKFVKYNHPNLVQAVGGEDKMIELMKRMIGNLKDSGFVFESIGFDEPSKMIQAGTEWQTTITQYLVMKTPAGRLKATSTLVAFSMDDGVTWKFADASQHDLATVRKLLPTLSEQINVPKKKPPVYLKD